MEDQIMNTELVRKGDEFSVSEIACRLKVSNHDARIMLDNLVSENLLIKELRKNHISYRLRTTSLINSMKLSKWQPDDGAFRGWL